MFAEPRSNRCPVRILDSYLAKLPANPSAFYLQWLPRVPKNPTQPWYKQTRVGINPLKNMMPTISARAGLGVRYTNHSLRATAATCMFAAGIPEKVVSEVTGHKSLNDHWRTSNVLLVLLFQVSPEEKPNIETIPPLIPSNAIPELQTISEP